MGSARESRCKAIRLYKVCSTWHMHCHIKPHIIFSQAIAPLIIHWPRRSRLNQWWDWSVVEINCSQSSPVTSHCDSLVLRVLQPAAILLREAISGVPLALLIKSNDYANNFPWYTHAGQIDSRTPWCLFLSLSHSHSLSLSLTLSHSLTLTLTLTHSYSHSLSLSLSLSHSLTLTLSLPFPLKGKSYTNKPGLKQQTVPTSMLVCLYYLSAELNSHNTNMWNTKSRLTSLW